MLNIGTTIERTIEGNIGDGLFNEGGDSRLTDLLKFINIIF